MAPLLDHLSAVLVASVVLLLLLAAGLRRQEEARSVTTHYVEQRQAAQFVETFERDIQSALAVEEASATRLALVVSSDPLSGTEQRVEYRASPLPDGEHLEVRRFVNGVEAGGAGQILSWSLQGLADDGSDAPALTAIRALTVRVSFPRQRVSAGDTGGAGATAWESTFHPPGLSQRTL